MQKPMVSFKLYSHVVGNRGFALVVTLSLLVLLTIIAVGLLSLSAVTLRSSSQDTAQAEARANARLALMIAIGELQKEMGPDMRVSAEAAIFDADPKTEVIESVAQPHWLASYDSWGNWLNAEYAPPGKSPLSIRDTYVSKRATMFRRWLLSMPTGADKNVDAADSLSGWNDTNSVVLVGKGSLGSLASSQPSEVTRAYLARIGSKGRCAWWIGAENHKAKVDLAAKHRELETDEWAVAQGSTAQVAAGAMTGMEAIDGQTPEMDAKLSKVISLQTLSVPSLGLDPDDAKSHFFDLTDSSKGILTNVRSGGLKKDLSLLLDRNNADLPSPYQYVATENVESSIRPLSSDILAKGAAVPNRPFASWQAMRRYYQMYKTIPAADVQLKGSSFSTLLGRDSLTWSGNVPYTEVLSTRDYLTIRNQWSGENSYMRMPIIAKLTFLHLIKTEPNAALPGQYLVRHQFSPIITIWNPYNTEMRFPSGQVGIPASINHTWPTGSFLYRDGIPQNNFDTSTLGTHGAYLHSDSGSDIILNPGEFKVFSYRSVFSNALGNQRFELYPGFNPAAIGGNVSNVVKSYPQAEIDADRIGLQIAFNRHWWHNRQNGHTPGGLSAGLVWGDWYQYLPNLYQIDWFNTSQTLTKITDQTTYFNTSPDPVLVGYSQLALKGLGQPDYETIDWEKDWRVRNWIQSPPGYFGNGLYMSENATTAHTQRLDSPYVISFGPVSALELPKVVGHIGERAFLGSGSSPYEKVTAVPVLELPTAPISNLAGFSGMRMSPGWIWGETLFPDRDGYGTGILMRRGAPPRADKRISLVNATSKRVAYQSGITGPGIGNSFMHPMIPRTGVYGFHDNSISQDRLIQISDPIIASNTRAYSDFWDHVFVLNDALWDDYYVSTLANQTRTGAPNALTLSSNIDVLTSGAPIANPRFEYCNSGRLAASVKTDLQAQDGYLKSAAYLMVDGSFNVNSTSVQAWYALFAGIRERQLYYRTQTGTLEPVAIPANARIALSRFETPNSDEEVTDPATGVTRDDGNQTWSGVRFLTNAQLELLAEKCVEQVKRRGPFLNFSEFINRRLSADALGVMGALQSAIDYDDAAPDSNSINYLYKQSSGLMINATDLGAHEFQTPEAAEGSRLAGTPGYIIQSDLLKPIASTLTVRDDTFRIRSYGESLNATGNVEARAWCEVIIQRMPEYYDPTNAAEIPAQLMNSAGDFEVNPALTALNRMFGRKFQLISFRWLNANEI